MTWKLLLFLGPFYGILYELHELYRVEYHDDKNVMTINSKGQHQYYFFACLTIVYQLHKLQSNDGIHMNDELGRQWGKNGSSYLKLLSQHVPGGTEYKSPSRGW
jgi:hypothetical protein